MMERLQYYQPHLTFNITDHAIVAAKIERIYDYFLKYIRPQKPDG